MVVPWWIESDGGGSKGIGWVEEEEVEEEEIEEEEEEVEEVEEEEIDEEEEEEEEEGRRRICWLAKFEIVYSVVDGFEVAVGAVFRFEG
ncbi:hypothetical protein LWI28_017476 [Acer negundo]|uniref:Uncharacterized protein n=1 Tax=Acer negundo TaxID=4023 RepID=A0AAD5INH6_ACENE|nr:hypothetical protein LWI28_017476 [Acer negundo]